MFYFIYHKMQMTNLDGLIVHFLIVCKGSIDLTSKQRPSGVFPKRSVTNLAPFLSKMSALSCWPWLKNKIRKKSATPVICHHLQSYLTWYSIPSFTSSVPISQASNLRFCIVIFQFIKIVYNLQYTSIPHCKTEN